ncbi:MAG: enoyl-CoA hydratase/isomerase family protein [Dehalococcoidales bacterium]|nr:enoyl-CoA hydratase/isomerase family protein [Dehalococcoidales bacterium]
MEYKAILYNKDAFTEGAVATITLNRPDKLNAMDLEMTNEIIDAVSQAEDDDDVKAIVFKGAGPSFSAGYDLRRVYYVYGGGSGKPEDTTRRPSQRSRFRYDKWRSETLRRIFTCSKITIASIHGYCVGGGLYVSLCCDLTIAAQDAQIGHAEQRLGFSGTMYVLPIEIMLIGQKKAREMLLLGSLINGTEAERIGLVNRVVPGDKLEEETKKWAQAMTLLPRDGIAIGKAFSGLAYDSLGMMSGFTQGYVGHSFFTNVRFESDEFNFLKTRRDKGVKAAFTARDKRYEDLGL